MQLSAASIEHHVDLAPLYRRFDAVLMENHAVSAVVAAKAAALRKLLAEVNTRIPLVQGAVRAGLEALHAAAQGERSLVDAYNRHLAAWEPRVGALVAAFRADMHANDASARARVATTVRAIIATYEEDTRRMRELDAGFRVAVGMERSST